MLFPKAHEPLVDELMFGDALVIGIKGGRLGGKGSTVYATDVLMGCSSPGTTVVYKDTKTKLETGVVEQYANAISYVNKYLSTTQPDLATNPTDYHQNKSSGTFKFVNKSRTIFKQLVKRNDTAGLEAATESPFRFIIVDEATDIRDQNLFDLILQAVMGRGEGAPKIILIYNPTITADSPAELFLETLEEIHGTKPAIFHYNYDQNPFITQRTLDYIDNLKVINPAYYNYTYLGIGGIVNDKAFPPVVTFSPEYVRQIQPKRLAYVIDYGKGDAIAAAEVAQLHDATLKVTHGYYRRNVDRPLTIAQHVDLVIQEFELVPRPHIALYCDWPDMTTEFQSRGFVCMAIPGKDLLRQYRRSYEMVLAGAIQICSDADVFIGQLQNARVGEDGTIVKVKKDIDDKKNDHAVDVVMYIGNIFYKEWRYKSIEGGSHRG